MRTVVNQISWLPFMNPAFILKLPTLAFQPIMSAPKFRFASRQAFIPLSIYRQHSLATKARTACRTTSFSRIFASPLAISISRPAPVSAPQPVYGPANLKLSQQSTLAATAAPPKPSDSSMTPTAPVSSPAPETSLPPPRYPTSSASASVSSSAYDSGGTGTMNVHEMTAIAMEDPDLFSDKRGRPRGHRHSVESRRKIGLANRGNVPWNKGRPHSEETKRKIAENTRRAMLRPELRQILKQRAIGRRHSEETKLKIRHTARLVRGGMRPNKVPKRAVPFAFGPTVIKNINRTIDEQMGKAYTMDDTTQKLLVQSKRPMSEQAKQKLSKRIKEMWSDPAYRSKVSTGIEAHQKKRREEKGVNETGLDQLSAQFVQRASQRFLRTASPGKRARVSKAKTWSAQATGVSNSIIVQNKLKQEISNDKADKNSIDIFDNDNSDMILPASDLNGLTKEDLGLEGFHGEGLIPGYDDSSINDMTDLTLPQISPPLDSMAMHEVDLIDGSSSMDSDRLPSGQNGIAPDGVTKVTESNNVGPMEGLPAEENVQWVDERMFNERDGFDGVYTVTNADNFNSLDYLPTTGDLDAAMRGLNENREVSLMETTGQDVFPNARNMGSPFGAVTPLDSDAFAPSLSAKYGERECLDMDREADSSSNKVDPSNAGDSFANPFSSLDGF